MVPSSCKEMRNIMSLELQNRGVVPDKRVYEMIAREYNTRVVDVAMDAGQHITRWTRKDVQLHYEGCIKIVPRLEIAQQYKRIKRIKDRLICSEMYITNDDGFDVINQKALDNYLKLEARASDMLKQYALFQKSDLAHLYSSNLEAINRTSSSLDQPDRCIPVEAKENMFEL